MARFDKNDIWGVLFIFCMAGIILIGAAAPASADTGTYVIEKEYVDLYVNSNTNVIIKYDVDFKVTGGSIPWVTMGLPNSNFDIMDKGGAVEEISKKNDYGWSGVYLGLDNNYEAGDTFNYKFSAIQKGFVKKANANEATIQFTPVWWDNAVIKDLKVTYHAPPGTESVKSSDNSAVFGANNTVTWQWANVPNGARKTTGITMNATLFPSFSAAVAPTTSGNSVPVTAAPVQSEPSTSESSGNSDLSVIFWGGLCALVVIGLFWLFGDFGNDSSKPKIPPDGYVPPKMTLNSPYPVEKKIVRNLTMNCINDAKNMVEVKTDGAKAAICMLCGALFFDRGEIEKALKAKIKETDFNKSAKQFAINGSANKPKNFCPRCGGTLKVTTKAKDDVSATLAYCDDCGGLWLEYGEYTKVAKIFDKQKDEFKKNGGGDNKNNWLFYPYIYHPHVYGASAYTSSSSHVPSSYSGGHYGGGGASTCVHSSCVSSCACVSCACVACACACACAGGGAAGCSPKDKFNRMDLYDPPFIGDENEDH